jgi:hypothetical protein
VSAGIASEGDPRGSVPQFVPPGHFYSPVPDPSAIGARIEGLLDARRPMPGLATHDDVQFALARKLLAFLAHFDPPLEQDRSRARYWSQNPFYPFGDAALLSLLVHELAPRRAVEIGSGFSSAALLDARDRERANGRKDVLGCVRFVEPYPERLLDLMDERDRAALVRVPTNGTGAALDAPLALDARPLEESDLAWIDALGARDLLIVDSSHVLKTGSDVFLLFDRILPALARGVWIHVHDVAWPFEYPRPWLTEGRAWNEAYALKLFLQYNAAFALRMQLTYVLSREPGVLFPALGLPAGLDGPLPAGFPLAAVRRLLAEPGSAAWLERLG